MMKTKLTEYQTYESHKVVIFTYDDSYHATFTLCDDGTRYVEVQDGFPLDDLKECIAIIDSGRLEIDL